MDSRQPAAASQADATVHVTTWSPAPSPDTAAHVVTAKHQDSCAFQQNFTLGPELKLPALAHPLHSKDAKQSPAAVEAPANTSDADLQHINTSDLQDLLQGWNSLASQDTIGIAAPSDAPALAHTRSGSAQQHESGIVIDDAETMLHFAEQASTGVSMPHCTAAFDTAHDTSNLLEFSDFMETSTGCGEHEASLCCHLDCICSQDSCCKR